MLPGIGNRVRRLRATRGRTMSDPAYQQEMATTCPPAAVINLLFKTWLRVRQVYDPNAWDVGEEAKKRKHQEEEHGAEEPVWIRESAFNLVLLSFVGLFSSGCREGLSPLRAPGLVLQTTPSSLTGCPPC